MNDDATRKASNGPRFSNRSPFVVYFGGKRALERRFVEVNIQYDLTPEQSDLYETRDPSQPKNYVKGHRGGRYTMAYDSTEQEPPKPYTTDDEIERQEFFHLYKAGVAAMLPPVLRQRLLVARRPCKLCAFYLELYDWTPEVLQLEHHHAAGSG